MPCSIRSSQNQTPDSPSEDRWVFSFLHWPRPAVAWLPRRNRSQLHGWFWFGFGLVLGRLGWIAPESRISLVIEEEPAQATIQATVPRLAWSVSRWFMLAWWHTVSIPKAPQNMTHRLAFGFQEMKPRPDCIPRWLRYGSSRHHKKTIPQMHTLGSCHPATFHMLLNTVTVSNHQNRYRKSDSTTYR